MLEICTRNGGVIVINITHLEVTTVAITVTTKADKLPWLTAKEEKFCAKYVETRNYTTAYRAAYPYGPDEGAILLKSAKIQGRIKELTNATAMALKYGLIDVVRHYIDIVTADPDELVSVKIGCCRYCHGDDHKYQWREREFIEAVEAVDVHNRANPKGLVEYPDIKGGLGYLHTVAPFEECPECGGEGITRIVARDSGMLSPGAAALYRGAKPGKYGIEIQIADKDKALDKLATLFGGATENINVRQLVEMLQRGSVPERVLDVTNLTAQQASDAYAQMLAGGAMPKLLTDSSSSG